MFYDDHGRISGRKPIWVQGILIALVWIFERLRLYTNMWKSKFMTYTPVFIWVRLGKYAYKQWAEVGGFTFGGLDRTRVSCGKCGITMAVSSLRQQFKGIHGRVFA